MGYERGILYLCILKNLLRVISCGNGPNDLSGGKATFNLSLSTPLNSFEFFTMGIHFFNNKKS